MNIYLLGILATFVAYIWVGALVSKRVKDINDFYVAGRNTPAFLITGSLVASFIGPGMFMGDAGETYRGYFGPILLSVGIMSVGYILGSVFFGRFLRRSGVMTIPEFFGKRFDSPALKSLTTITSTFTMLVYSLSTVQGGATLMAIVSGISYEACVILVAIAFTLITVFSGARGVLITDTIMFGIFSIATVLGVVVISQATGGWFSTVTEMATYQPVPGILAGSGNLDYSYPTAGENVAWAIGYGIAWLSVLMIAPWQSSRYLMAKDEHAVIRSSILASFSVTILNFLILMAGVLVNKLNPNLAEQSHVLIWASINVMPTVLGIAVLAGVLAAALSSATTFLSLIGSNIANDILKIKGPRSLMYGRLIVTVVGAVIALVCVINPPQIFWIVYMGATIISCSWLPVSIASVWSKRVTKTGAFWSMLVGFVISSVLKLYIGISGISLPIYLDPFFIGFGGSVIALIIGSAVTKVTAREAEERRLLFIMPEKEKNPAEIRKTKTMIATTIPLGVLTTTILLVLWVIPYLNGL